MALTVRNDITSLNECIVVELKTQKYKCFLSCLYRSPSQSDDELGIFIDDLENTLTKSPLVSIVLGDFSTDLSLIDKWASQWKIQFNPDPKKSASEIVFSHKLKKNPHPPLKLNNLPIVPQTSTKKKKGFILIMAI